MTSNNVFTNDSDADEVRSVYAFDMTSYEEIVEQYHGNDAASDADEVRSVYAFESTSYGTEETTKADETLYRQDLTSFNLFNLYPPVGYKTVEHRNTDADINDDAIESNDDDAFEKESVYAYEKPNATCPNDYHEHEGCFCGKPADYDLCDVKANDEEESVGETDAEKDAAIQEENRRLRAEMCRFFFKLWELSKAYGVSDAAETGEKASDTESVYAYEKPSKKCPINWPGHEGCRCSEDYREEVEDADGNDDAIEQVAEDAFEKESVYAFEKDSAKEIDNNVAVKNSAPNQTWINKFASSLLNFNFQLSVPKMYFCLFLFAFFRLLAETGSEYHWHNGVTSLLVGQSDASLILAYISLCIHCFVAFDRIIGALFFDTPTKKIKHFGYQIKNHGTPVSYKMVTNDWTLEFINEKTTVYHDKSGSTITLHYSGSKVVSVTHDETTYTSYKTVPSKVADMLVAARCAVNQLWQ